MSNGWFHGDGYPSIPPPEEFDALERRVAERLTTAPRSGATGQRPRLLLGEALLLAHDLHLLGRLPDAPSLRWKVDDAALALAPWDVHVVGDLPGVPLAD
ncbi:MAG TPA: hypothetical protein VFL69_16710 [Marmoricola sp.]|jgi:hypothetical protein|nr:hypothetical protein [Marmoricola sp.]